MFVGLAIFINSPYPLLHMNLVEVAHIVFENQEALRVDVAVISCEMEAINRVVLLQAVSDEVAVLKAEAIRRKIDVHHHLVLDKEFFKNSPDLGLPTS